VSETSPVVGDGAAVEVLLTRLRREIPAEEAPALVDKAIATCRWLYGNARSRDALPLAQAALAQARNLDDYGRIVRAATACGALASDMADVVGSVEYHVVALRTAMSHDDHVEMSRSWGNIGIAIGYTGNYEMSVRCFQRSLSLIEMKTEPVYSRLSACNNLADKFYKLGRVEEGLRYGQQALLELTPEFLEQDIHGIILLHRNLVRLHLADGNPEQAAFHVEQALALAVRLGTPRAHVAADITRASYELAIGRADVALTRLDQVLARARTVPPVLRDALACAVRAEEAVGNTARALMRLEELSDHVFGHAVERTRELLELAGMKDGAEQSDTHVQERVRLLSKLEPRSRPESWNTLQRLSVGAVMRVDETGWHGKRVGALTKALALSWGCPPLQALEIGLAAEVHDIGLLSVPEALLAKRGALNDAEHGLVQRHSDAGAEMLRDDEHPMVFMAREIAKYHHAHWDGNGYPERVGGKFIPMAARMCAIADAYDTMVCGLASKPPRTMMDALGRLGDAAGTQFDPELVSCFDALIRSESEGLGVDLGAGSGMEDFQELVLSLKEDRGFA
jgi:putative two-component system response regulator